MGISRSAQIRAAQLCVSVSVSVSVGVGVGVLVLVLASPHAFAAAAPAPASAATAEPTVDTLRAEIRRHIATLGDGQGPPRLRACKTNSEGVCRYRKREKAEEGEGDEHEPAPTSEERALIAAYEALLAQADSADADHDERQAFRYHLAKLLVKTGNVEAALAHLIVLTETAQSSEIAAWGAQLLLDELTVQWTQKTDLEASRRSAVRLKKQLARLQSLPLWHHQAVRPLRELAPRLDAGIRWREAYYHLEHGKRARRLADSIEAYLACADSFRSLHADYVEHARADTLLWSAAMCFEAGLDPMAAVAEHERLLELDPDSPHAQEAAYIVPTLLMGQARYERAVESFERFAARYPKEYRVGHALGYAVELRAALGPPEALGAALSAYEALYRRKDPRRAAEIFWSGYSLLTTDDRSRRDYAEKYLKVYGRRGGTALEVIAWVALADAMWSQTCPLKETEAGLCVAVTDGQEVTLRSTDTANVSRHRLHRRKVRRRLGADAWASLEGFRRAMILREHRRDDLPPGDSRLRDDLFYASARAWVALADALFESLIDGTYQAPGAGRPPKTRDPRADPWRSPGHPLRGHEAASIPDGERLSIIAELSGPLAVPVDQLDRAYASIELHYLGTPAAATAIARRGQLREWLLDHLLIGTSSASPACESTGDHRGRCTTAKTRVDVLRSSSRDAYARCVAHKPPGVAPKETVELCLRKLAILDPTNSALIPEMLGSLAAYDTEEPAALADRAGLITDYETALLEGPQAGGE